MIPTFVIGLREGLEAALIVGIVAAFLNRSGRRDALKWMWLGVLCSLTLCAAFAWALDATDSRLPQAQQEGLETVIALFAVGMVTYMIAWMKRHSRGIKRALEQSAAGAIARGSVGALVAMAFLAVLREGIETAVFLLAVFQTGAAGASAKVGVVLGVALAAAIGWGIYRGSVRIDLSRLFRATGTVLVLVAGGLVASALHSAHEAGWLNALQGRAFDLEWLVEPGSVRASLVTGIFGIQPQPTVAEVLGWLAYVVPMTAFVAWPQRRRVSRSEGVTVAAAALLCVSAVLLGGCGNGASSSSAKGGSGSAGARTIEVELHSDGCTPAQLTARPGPVTFHVRNVDSAKVSEWELVRGSRIVGEQENLAPGLDGSFSLDLERGTYTLHCGTKKYGELHVSGTSTRRSGGSASADGNASKLRAMAVQNYVRYVQAQTDELVTRTTAFTAAVEAGDVAKAKQLYGAARAPYERVEPIAESFGDLDPRIDARENDVEPGTEWTGFHRIEQALWVKDSTAGMAPVAKQLQADVEELDRKVAKLTLQPAQIANGAVDLLGEVSKSKITGEEERYSRIDLLDFAANVEGAHAAFEAVRPLLDPKGSAELDARFTAVDEALAPYRHGQEYVAYTTLEQTDKRALSRAIDALAEPLSQVAAKIA